MLTPLICARCGALTTTRIGSQQTTSILPTDHSYFWQVSACNGAGCTPSGWGKFKRR